MVCPLCRGGALRAHCAGSPGKPPSCRWFRCTDSACRTVFDAATGRWFTDSSLASDG